MLKTYKGDKWSRAYSVPMLGKDVRVVRHFPRRRVLIEHDGKLLLTFLWCLSQMRKKRT